MLTPGVMPCLPPCSAAPPRRKATTPYTSTINDGVPRLNNNPPSFESVVSKCPGLVATRYEWMIAPKGAVGSREQFAQLGIPTYVLPADCEGKNNLVGADGTRIAACSIETLYKGIT